MTKKITLVLSALAISAFTLVACNKDASKTVTPTPVNSPATVSSKTAASGDTATATTPTATSASTSAKQDSNSAEKTFTLEELKKFNGENGNPAYVAISGTVYDVTNNKAWKNGMHKGNTAGMDLTEELKKAPHESGVLPKLPVVGKLAK